MFFAGSWASEDSRREEDEIGFDDSSGMVASAPGWHSIMTPARSARYRDGNGEIPAESRAPVARSPTPRRKRAPIGGNASYHSRPRHPPSVATPYYQDQRQSATFAVRRRENICLFLQSPRGAERTIPVPAGAPPEEGSPSVILHEVQGGSSFAVARPSGSHRTGPAMPVAPERP